MKKKSAIRVLTDAYGEDTWTAPLKGAGFRVTTNADIASREAAKFRQAMSKPGLFDDVTNTFSKRSSTKENKVKIAGLMKKMGFEKGAAKIDKMLADPDFVARLTSTPAGKEQLKQLGIRNVGKGTLDLVSSGRPYNPGLFGELMANQRRINAPRNAVFSEIAGAPMAHYYQIGDVPQSVRERMGAIRATQGAQTRKLLRRIATKDTLRRIISRAKSVAPYAAGAAALGGGAYYLANRGAGADTKDK